MQVHVLNGDALAENFTLEGKVIICRECLIEGPLDATSTQEFFLQRSAYLSETFALDVDYKTSVESEFNKLLSVGPDDEINLWFEHDLFCQVNLWFILDWIVSHKLPNQIFRINPLTSSDDQWSGFSTITDHSVGDAFSQRIEFTPHDLQVAKSLWEFYRSGDKENLRKIGKTKSDAFPYLTEVCEAHLQRFPQVGLGRPQLKLIQLQRSGLTNFKTLFQEFQKTESIYGFGDSQVKNMLMTLPA